MNIPGQSVLVWAKRAGNKVNIPMTRDLGLADFVVLVFQQAGSDNLTAFAGYLVYSAVFTVFPFLTLLLSLLGLFNQGNLLTSLKGYAANFMPRQAAGFLANTIFGIVQNKSGGAFTLGALISIAIALWGVSGGFRAIMTAMNVMYEVEEGRPFWKRYAVSVLLAIGAVGMLTASLVLLVFGSQLGEKLAKAIGLGAQFRAAWDILRWPVLLFLVLLAFALIYHFAPNIEQGFRVISPGNVLAVVMWLIFSLVFSVYVNNFSNYSNTYGAFAGVALLLLYLYYSSYILLLGAEMNQVVSSHPNRLPAQSEPAHRG